MARSKQSQKRHRTDQVRRMNNRSKMSRLRTAIKRTKEAESVEEKRKAYCVAQKLLDKAGRARLLHPNKAIRLKKKLVKQI